ILGISKGILRVFSSDFPLLGVPPIPVLCSIILTSDFPLLEAQVALIAGHVDSLVNPIALPRPAPTSSRTFQFCILVLEPPPIASQHSDEGIWIVQWKQLLSSVDHAPSCSNAFSQHCSPCSHSPWLFECFMNPGDPRLCGQGLDLHRSSLSHQGQEK
ncbi:hypothetical protein L208DRAFT_1338494, partial [Tricholoma matsutake]